MRKVKVYLRYISYSSGNKKFCRNSKYNYEYSRNSGIPKVEMRVDWKNEDLEIKFRK